MARILELPVDYTKLRPTNEDWIMKTVANLSDPELVRIIRKFTKDQAVWKLTHMGEDPPTGPLLRAAMNEATRRKITIEHPELS